MKRLLLITVSAALLFSACGKQSATELPVEPFEVILARAQDGDADAQFQVGASYHDGQSGIPKNLATAKEWFEKSAAKGDERAEFNLGVMYYSGEGIPQNYAKAREWFEKAVAQKNARAQFNLGIMYYRGEGVEQNFPQAIEYFSESGAQGFNEAQFNLGVMYAKGEGVDPDIDKAYAWFTAAQKYGNERAADVIKEIKGGLDKDQLKVADGLAMQLLDMIDKNIDKLKQEAASGL